MIFCFGDSFTYGHELSNPNKHAWPSVLGNLLRDTCENHSMSGATNSWISRTAVTKCLESRPDIAIVSWTTPNRYEFFKTANNNISSVCVNVDWASSNNFAKQLYTDWHDNDGKHLEWIHQILILQNFFKQQKIKYIFASVFDMPGKNQNNEQINKLTSYIDKANYIGYPNGNFLEWTRNTELGKGGHPLEQGHQLIAEKMYEYIRN